MRALEVIFKNLLVLALGRNMKGLSGLEVRPSIQMVSGLSSYSSSQILFLSFTSDRFATS
jgi:hypothetical protein